MDISYRSIGADGGERVGSTSKQPVSIHQQHPDVVLTFLLRKHTKTHTHNRLEFITHKKTTSLSIDRRCNIWGAELHSEPIN